MGSRAPGRRSRRGVAARADRGGAPRRLSRASGPAGCRLGRADRARRSIAPRTSARCRPSATGSLVERWETAVGRPRRGRRPHDPAAAQLPRAQGRGRGDDATAARGERRRRARDDLGERGPVARAARSLRRPAPRWRHRARARALEGRPRHRASTASRPSRRCARSPRCRSSRSRASRGRGLRRDPRARRPRPDRGPARQLGRRQVDAAQRADRRRRQETREIREDDRGRHTTTRRELFVAADGGLWIDTPGMRELAQWIDDTAEETAFDDITALAAHCKFRDCRHGAEPGCAVQGAVAPERLASFHKLADRALGRRDQAERGPAPRGVRRSRARSWPLRMTTSVLYDAPRDRVQLRHASSTAARSCSSTRRSRSTPARRSGWSDPTAPARARCSG